MTYASDLAESKNREAGEVITALQIKSVHLDHLEFIDSRQPGIGVTASWICKHRPIPGGYLVAVMSTKQGLFMAEDVFEICYRHHPIRRDPPNRELYPVVDDEPKNEGEPGR